MTTRARYAWTADTQILRQERYYQCYVQDEKVAPMCILSKRSKMRPKGIMCEDKAMLGRIRALSVEALSGRAKHVNVDVCDDHQISTYL